MHAARRFAPLSQAPGNTERGRSGWGAGENVVSAPEHVQLDQFLERASERLQFLREYSSLVQEAAPRREEVEQLHEAAHWLDTEAAGQGYPLFSEIAGRMAHV